MTPLEHMKSRRDELVAHLEVWKSGKLNSGQNDGRGWVDTTEQTIAREKAALEELNRVIENAETQLAAAAG